MSTVQAPNLVSVTATAHHTHWNDILNLILKLAPLGAAISANFTSTTVAAQVNESVALAEQVEPIVISIAGITPPAGGTQ